MVNWKGFGRKPSRRNRDTILAFAGETEENLLKPQSG
jgi:hypothetical protein